MALATFQPSNTWDYKAWVDWGKGEGLNVGDIVETEDHPTNPALCRVFTPRSRVHLNMLRQAFPLYVELKKLEDWL